MIERKILKKLCRYRPAHKIDPRTGKIFPEQMNGRRSKHRVAHAKNRADEENLFDPLSIQIEALFLRFGCHAPQDPFQRKTESVV